MFVFEAKCYRFESCRVFCDAVEVELLSLDKDGNLKIVYIVLNLLVFSKPTLKGFSQSKVNDSPPLLPSIFVEMATGSFRYKGKRSVNL